MSLSSRRRLDLGRVVLGGLGVVVSVFLLVPLLTIVAASFTSGEYITVPPQLPPSIRWYQTFFADPIYFGAFQNSLVVAAVVTSLALLIGTSAALGLTRRSFPGREAVYAMLLLPFLIPGIVLGIGVAVSLRPLGLEALRGTFAIIVMGHLLWATPLVFVVMVAKLRELDPDLPAAALSLGARPWKVFLEITLPLIAPAFFASATLAFVVSLHDFAMALFLVAPDTTTLPVLAWNSLRFEVRPIIAASDTVMVAFVIGALIALGRFVGLDKITAR